MWSNYENGRVPHPKLDMFEHMAYPFMVHPRELVANVPPPVNVLKGMPDGVASTCATWKGKVDPATGEPVERFGALPIRDRGIRDMITGAVPRKPPQWFVDGNAGAGPHHHATGRGITVQPGKNSTATISANKSQANRLTFCVTGTIRPCGTWAQMQQPQENEASRRHEKRRVGIAT